MKKILACVLTGIAVTSAFAFESEAINVRNADAARTWQVNLSPGEPIGWPWGEADAATLVVSNAVEKTERYYQVSRSGDEPFGSCTIDLPSDAAACEYVLILSLTLTAEEAEVGRMNARVANLPDAFAVNRVGGKDWRRLTRPRVFAYDAEWTGAEAEAAELTLAAGDQTEGVPLAGIAGYDVIDPEGVLGDGFSGLFRAALSFDGSEAFASDLRFGIPGFLLMLK